MFHDKPNVLFSWHSGANCQYFTKVAKSLSGRKKIEFLEVRRNEFLGLDLSRFDFLVYQTFPNETHWKHNKILVGKLDQKFMTFKKEKILLDSFDDGREDGYTRFNGEYPRIKVFPSPEYESRCNVVLAIGGQILLKKIEEPLIEKERGILFHYAPTIGVYPHRIRDGTLEILKSFGKDVCLSRIPSNEYLDFLRTVRVSITVPGFGTHSNAAYEALRMGSMLLVHEQIKEVRALPFETLVDGEDCVIFNLENLGEKIRWVMKNPEQVERIRLSGHQKFLRGYDIVRSADLLLSYFKKTRPIPVWT